MSKASEYAKARKESGALWPGRFLAEAQGGMTERNLIANVDENGALSISGRGYLTLEEIPTFIKWLRETFED